MEAIIYRDLFFILRILVAGICGAIIGFERESKQKSAGFRTHIIVAMAAALMVIISKHGFDDVLYGNIRLDPSRIAAGVVTAIGFIGSGVILMKDKLVTGLTTSAGIWATVGVGMSIGVGMYALGIATSVFVVLVEIFVGKANSIIPKIKGRAMLTIESNSYIHIGEITDILKRKGIIIESISYMKDSDILYKMNINLNVYNFKGNLGDLVDELNNKYDFNNLYISE